MRQASTATASTMSMMGILRRVLAGEPGVGWIWRRSALCEIGPAVRPLRPPGHLQRNGQSGLALEIADRWTNHWAGDYLPVRQREHLCQAQRERAQQGRLSDPADLSGLRNRSTRPASASCRSRSPSSSPTNSSGSRFGERQHPGAAGPDRHTAAGLGRALTAVYPILPTVAPTKKINPACPSRPG